MKILYSFTTAFLLAAGGLTAQEKAAFDPLPPDLPPEVIKPISNFEASEDEENISITLRDHFYDPNNPDGLMLFEVLLNSYADVANATVLNQELIIGFLSPGQTRIIVQANSGGLTTTDTFAIGVRPVIEEGYDIAGFDEIQLDNERFWNGSDGSGSFLSGNFRFKNDYNAEWFSWSGWAYSNTTDNTTPGFMNQYSAYSPVRIDSAGGVNYGLTYIYGLSEIELDKEADTPVRGFFITNSTYAALSMLKGDEYTKKFGGSDGNDPDWFKLTVTGYDLEGNSGQVDFMLADFTFEDSSKDYIVETWQWVDLSGLGPVHRLNFNLSSSDNGDFGMNTPAFFCMDKLCSEKVSGISRVSPDEINLFPNPSNGIFRISSAGHGNMEVIVFEPGGKKVLDIQEYIPGNTINLGTRAKGSYFVKLLTPDSAYVKQILIL